MSGESAPAATIEHIERPRPPWRRERMTECGRLVGEFAQVLSPEEFADKWRRLGQQRAAMTTCMTCVNRYSMWASEPRSYYGSWDDDPVPIVGRDTHGKGAELLRRELRVLSLMYEAHREEFEEALAGLDDAPSLPDVVARRRAARNFARRSRR